MEAWIEFARGPLFRFSLAVMVLGLMRILALDLIAAWVAYRKAGDKTLPWSYIVRRTLQWSFPVNRVFTSRPFYSISSVLFHVGLLLVPIFLYAHIQLWQNSFGISWPALPKLWADWLTISTIVFAVVLLVSRALNKTSNFLSRKQDYLWPMLLLLPFATGYLCANTVLSPAMYQLLMLSHILSAEAILLLMPFTKIAHCVLMPLSQFISNLAWKFPANTDEAICVSLHKKGAKV